MSESQTKLGSDESGNNEHLMVEVLQPFRGTLGRQVDVVVSPPVSADEWDALTRSKPIFSNVTDVFEGTNVTRFRLLGEAVDVCEEFGVELKQELMAIRGIDAISNGKQNNDEAAFARGQEDLSLDHFREQLKQVCLDEYAQQPRTIDGFAA